MDKIFRIHGTGKSFFLSNTNFLDISLESTENIKIFMQSTPNIVTITLEKPSIDSPNTSILTLTGFKKNTTYYKFTNSFLNKEQFTTDDNGSFQFQCDLTSHHTIFIKETPSTIYLNEDGWYADALPDPTIGLWNPTTRLATLLKNVTDTIEINTDHSKPLVLDGNKKSIITNSIGILVPNNRHNISIKNFIFQTCNTGVYVSYDTNTISIENNTFIDNILAIAIYSTSSFDTIKNNLIRSTIPNSEGIYVDAEETAHTTIECNELFFENINFTNPGTSISIDIKGIILNETCLNTVKNNKIHFSNNQVSGSINNSYIYFHGIYINGSPSYLASRNIVDSNEIFIKNNSIYIDNTASGEKEHQTVLYGITCQSNTSGLIIKYNKIAFENNSVESGAATIQYSNNKFRGIYLGSSNNGNKVKSNIISLMNNSFNILSNNLSFTCENHLEGIYAMTSLNGSDIEDNQVFICKNSLIRVTNNYYINHLIPIHLSGNNFGNIIKNNLLKVIDNRLSADISGNNLLIGLYLDRNNQGNIICKNTILVKYNVLPNTTSVICSLIYFNYNDNINTIENNILTDCQGNGITFYMWSDSCLIAKNLIANNSGYGIVFVYTDNGCNKITYNIIENNNLGGLFISNSGYNVNNNIVNNNFINAPGKNAFISNISDNNYFNSNYWSDYNHLTPCYNVNNVIDCNPLRCPLLIIIDHPFKNSNKCSSICSTPYENCNKPSYWHKSR